MTEHRDLPEIAEKREAAVQAMIAKGHTRERAEYLLFEVVGKALFGPGGAFTEQSSPPAAAWCDCGLRPEHLHDEDGVPYDPRVVLPPAPQGGDQR